MANLFSTVPLLLLLAPLALAGVTILLRRWVWLQVLIATIGSALMALLALQVPLDQAVVFLGRDVLFRSEWPILGRSLIFQPGDRPALAFVFVISTLLFAGSAAGQVNRRFVPVALLMLSVLMAALFVEPFLFAALFLQVVAALAVLLLVEDQQTRGALRLLVFFTLGVPFILLAGWQVEAYASTPNNPALLDQARLLISIGFIILLGVVPFHSWVPTVAEESQPFASAFVFTVVQTAILFYLLSFLDAFEWMRAAQTYTLLQIGGVVLVIVGGVFSIGQQRLGRLLGYTMLIDFGAALLALSLASADGVRTALAILALRGLGLTVWGLGMSVLRRHVASDDFDSLLGIGRRLPFATAAVLVGGLSLVGLPLTAGFPGRWALYQLLAAENLAAALILLGASVGVLLAYARAASGFLARPTPQEDDQSETQTETPVTMLATGMGIGLLLLLGIFPQLLLPAVTAAAQTFSRLMN